jgi:hypothetical protein
MVLKVYSSHIFLSGINGSKKVQIVWNILKKAVVQKHTDAVKELKNIQNLAV